MKKSFGRDCVGPRGGRVVLATPCSECVAYRTCRPASISEPWGCESWADDHGHRAFVEPIGVAFKRALAEDEEREPLPDEMFPHDEEDGISSDHLDIGAFESREGAGVEPELEVIEPMERPADLGPLFVGAR